MSLISFSCLLCVNQNSVLAQLWVPISRWTCVGSFFYRSGLGTGFFEQHDYLSWLDYFDIIRIILGMFNNHFEMGISHLAIVPKASIHVRIFIIILLCLQLQHKDPHLGRYIHGRKEMTHTHYFTQKNLIALVLRIH